MSVQNNFEKLSFNKNCADVATRATPKNLAATSHDVVFQRPSLTQRTGFFSRGDMATSVDTSEALSSSKGKSEELVMTVEAARERRDSENNVWCLLKIPRR